MRFTAIICAILLSAAASPAFADYTYTILNDPDATGWTEPDGISGDTVVGRYFVADGSHGFIEANGVYTTLDDPLAWGASTRATGVDNGTVVGYYYTTNGTYHGFIEKDGVYTTLDDTDMPAGGRGTFPTAISGNTVVGNFSDGRSTYGFTETNGVFTTITDPLAVQSLGGTSVNAIFGNTLGGSYIDATGVHGFVETNGVYTTLDDPNSPNWNSVQGISGTTLIGDHYQNSEGFVEQDGLFSSMPNFATQNSSANAISGTTIVGSYLGIDGVPHGYIATLPEPSTLTLLITATCLCTTRRRHHELTHLHPQVF